MIMASNEDAGSRPSEQSMNQAAVEIIQVLNYYGLTLTEGVGVLQSIQYDLLAKMRDEDTEVCE